MVWVAGAYLLSREVSKDGLMVVLIVHSINCWYDVVLRKYTRRGDDIWVLKLNSSKEVNNKNKKAFPPSDFSYVRHI